LLQLASNQTTIVTESHPQPQSQPVVADVQAAALPGYTQSLTATAHFYRALDFLDKRNLELARQEYEQAIMLDKSFARAYINLGVVNLQMGQFEAASTNISEGLKIFPDSQLGHYNLGLLHAHQGNLNQAIDEFTKALKINPGSAEVLVEQGKAYYIQKDFQRAMAAYRQALTLNDDYAPAHYYLGVIYRRQNNAEAAMREWQKTTLSEEPSFKDVRQLAHKQIGDLYYSAKKYDLALSNYEKALEIKRESDVRGELLLRLGKVYLQTNALDRAVPLFEQAMDYLPNNPDLHLCYGSALLGNRENDRAMAEFQTTVKLDPDGRYGRKAYEFLKQLRGY
jgi:tetratricopeptide (TPR) repeat protein